MAFLSGCVGIAIGRVRAVGTRPLVRSHVLDTGRTTCQDHSTAGLSVLAKHYYRAHDVEQDYVLMCV